MKNPLHYCLYFTIILSVWSCQNSKKELDEFQPYHGPVIEARDIETIYSDSAKVKMIVEGPLQRQYENQDLDYPEGVMITFFNEKEEKASVLTADKGHFDKEKNIYTATGNVIVIDLIGKKDLKTEELHWSPVKKQIYTEEYVVITTPKQILKGNGLVAEQDFSQYVITKPTGIISVDEDE
ncbi:MAG: LPS export ABC transporter periplasmic protein LptC [Thermonemataceae bacterium]